MDQEFLNIYIEKILSEVSELTKVKLLLQTQLAYSEKQINDSVELQNKLQQSNNELMEKIAETVKKDRTTEFEQVIESIKNERATLQHECNELRKNQVELLDEIVFLKTEIAMLKTKKKKTQTP